MADLKFNSSFNVTPPPSPTAVWADIIGKPALRDTLSANRIYYVSPVGDDSNTGLTIDAPFLNLQKAIDTICSIDTSVYQVTIQLANGTYNINSEISLGSYVGKLAPIIQGNMVVPSNVLITRNTTGHVIVQNVVSSWIIQGIKISNTGAGASDGIRATAGSLSLSMIDFGPVTRFGMTVQGSASVNMPSTTINISGSMNMFLIVVSGYLNIASSTMNLTGTPAWGGSFVYASMGGELLIVEVLLLMVSQPDLNIQ